MNFVLKQFDDVLLNFSAKRTMDCLLYTSDAADE